MGEAGFEITLVVVLDFLVAGGVAGGKRARLVMDKGDAGALRFPKLLGVLLVVIGDLLVGGLHLRAELLPGKLEVGEPDALIAKIVGVAHLVAARVDAI